MNVSWCILCVVPKHAFTNAVKFIAEEWVEVSTPLCVDCETSVKNYREKKVLVGEGFSG